MFESRHQMRSFREQRGWLRMTLLACIWLASVGSAISVVYVTHASRTATHELETLRKQTNILRVESGQFLLERSALTAYSRVETIAHEQLNMFIPENSRIVVVNP